MLILLIFAVLSLIVGVLFIANFKILENFISTLNKIVINTHDIAATHKKILGFLLIMFSVVLVFIALKIGR